MKYMGSKSRIAPDIVPIIQRYVNLSQTGFYYEPFCGGCNIIDKVDAKRKFASDKQEYLIQLLSNLNELHSLPSHISKELYDDVRASYHAADSRYEKWFIGAVGFLASYNGRFFDGGYAGTVTTKAGNVRDYYQEAKRNLEAQAPALHCVEFACGDFTDIDPVPGSVVYCDPPYANTKQYGVSKQFNYCLFWDWVRSVSKSSTVLVSEHAAPPDFDCIWERSVLRTIDNLKRVQACERLFAIHH